MQERINLEWFGPFALKSGMSAPPILNEPKADVPGLYCWVVNVNGKVLPHYVGETGLSIARRQCEHFRSYASGIYGVVDSAKFVIGEYDESLHKAPLWKKEGWRRAQDFIDNFEEYSGHIARMLSTIEIYCAKLETDRHTRCRIEGGLINLFYGLPEEYRGLYPPGFRRVVKKELEPGITVSNTSDFPVGSLLNTEFVV